MSLINDALKRAREAQYRRPPAGGRPLPPVEVTPRSGTGWILVAAAIFLLGAACFLIGLALFEHKTPIVATATVPASSMPLKAEAAQAPAPTPVASAALATVEAATVPVTSAPPPVGIVTNPPPVAVAREHQPKIQGIIFNTGQPLAIVNGRTVNVGDRVGDFQVRQILRNRVILQRADGSQLALTIGE